MKPTDITVIHIRMNKESLSLAAIVNLHTFLEIICSIYCTNKFLFLLNIFKMEKFYEPLFHIVQQKCVCLKTIIQNVAIDTAYLKNI